MKSEVRKSCSFYDPLKRTKTHYVEVVKHDVKGLGRWMYCKYCYKSVRPSLSGVNQTVCPECGAGLSPDFFKFENLLRWLKTGDSKIIEEDMNSKEAKEWLQARKSHK